MSLRSASLAQIIENSFIFEIRCPGLARCYLTASASPARSFYLARIMHTIETRLFPNSFVATLAILPSMSLIPSAPFLLLISYFFSCYASQIVEQDLHIAQHCPVIQNATAQSEATAERGIREIRAAVSLQRD